MVRKIEKNERRFDQYGEFRLLAAAEGWVMCRRKGAAPGAMTLKEWDAIPRFPGGTDIPKLTIVK